MGVAGRRSTQNFLDKDHHPIGCYCYDAVALLPNMPFSPNDYMSLLRLRYEFAAVRFQLALRAGFNPNQPRVGRGNPDGGQWTDGGGGGGARPIQRISSRPRGTATVRIGGRLVEATPAQQARLAVSHARAPRRP